MGVQGKEQIGREEAQQQVGEKRVEGKEDLLVDDLFQRDPEGIDVEEIRPRNKYQ